MLRLVVTNPATAYEPMVIQSRVGSAEWQAWDEKMMLAGARAASFLGERNAPAPTTGPTPAPRPFVPEEE